MAEIHNNLEEEVKKNYTFFKSKLPELLARHKGKYIVIRNEEIVGIYDSDVDALLAAKEKFSDEMYSIQQIIGEPVDLGSISAYAVL